jgi:hypothetical protein
MRSGPRRLVPTQIRSSTCPATLVFSSPCLASVVFSSPLPCFSVPLCLCVESAACLLPCVLASLPSSQSPHVRIAPLPPRKISHRPLAAPLPLDYLPLRVSKAPPPRAAGPHGKPCDGGARLRGDAPDHPPPDRPAHRRDRGPLRRLEGRHPPPAPHPHAAPRPPAPPRRHRHPAPPSRRDSMAGPPSGTHPRVRALTRRALPRELCAPRSPPPAPSERRRHPPPRSPAPRPPPPPTASKSAARPPTDSRPNRSENVITTATL